jgi:hypothetical protein
VLHFLRRNTTNRTQNENKNFNSEIIREYQKIRRI